MLRQRGNHRALGQATMADLATLWRTDTTAFASGVGREVVVQHETLAVFARQGIDDLYGDHPLRPVLLTALLEAADRVDSTVGLQMAYLKEWAPRALARHLKGCDTVLLMGATLGSRVDAAIRRLALISVAEGAAAQAVAAALATFGQAAGDTHSKKIR